MVAAKVGEKLMTPIYSDNEGNEVEKVEDALCKTKQLTQCSPIQTMYCLQMRQNAIPIRRRMDTLLAPNTSQKKEHGHKECHLPVKDTLQSFHSLLLMEGQCVVLSFFSQNNHLPIFEWAHGIDIKKQPFRNEHGEITQIENLGPGNFYPGGPACIFNGKKIDCSSKSGGITAEILVNILKYFDSREIFPQFPSGYIPFLIVDGHNTQLDPTFIAYINNIEHHWKVCFGLPHTASLLQVGDLAENNGTFKDEFYLCKR